MKWRIALIDAQKIFPAQELLSAINSLQKKTLDLPTKTRLVTLAQSDSVKLDELEMRPCPGCR